MNPCEHDMSYKTDPVWRRLWCRLCGDWCLCVGLCEARAATEHGPETYSPIDPLRPAKAPGYWLSGALPAHRVGAVEGGARP